MLLRLRLGVIFEVEVKTGEVENAAKKFHYVQQRLSRAEDGRQHPHG